MRRSNSLALVLTFAAIAWAEDVPPWLRDAAAATVPSYPPKVNAVILYNEESTVVSDTGRLTTTTRTAMRFINRQGGKGAAFYEEYDKSEGKVKDFRAWTIAASGKVIKYGKREILDLACAENDVYNECRRRFVSGQDDAEAGAVFGYEAVVERQVYVPQLDFHFGSPAPVRLARFSVTVTSSWEFKSRSFNGAPDKPVVAASTYSWEMKDLAAFETEPASPSALTVVPWIGVSLIGGSRSVTSWQAAAELEAEANTGVADPNEAITAKARELTANAASELEKIRAIGKFVQQTNYVSIQVNVSRGGGYRPHQASEVFEKRYGDCKDKANLVRAMLKSIGIEALPVAIYSGDRTRVARDWPSLGSFNHAISAIRVSPATDAPAVLQHPTLGRLLFFDPTDPYVPAGYLPDHEQGSFALVGDAEAGDLVQAPVGPARASDHVRTVSATLSGDGSVTGSFSDRRTGSELQGARAAYRRMTQPDYKAGLERWVALGTPGAALSDVQIHDDEGVFTTEAHFASPRYAQRPQRNMMIFRAGPLVHASPVSLTSKTRKYPVVLEADALDETVRLALPAGTRVDDIPEAVNLTSDFGRYRADWKLDGRTLVFHQVLEVEASTVPPERYGEVRKFLDKAYGSAGQQVVLVAEGGSD